MTSILVDTNVLIDIIANPDPASWSVQTLRKCAEAGELVINTVIWSDISGAYPVEPKPEVLFRGLILKIENLPVDAGYPAGAAHVAYRKAGGLRERTLPDFLNSLAGTSGNRTGRSPAFTGTTPHASQWIAGIGQPQ